MKRLFLTLGLLLTLALALAQSPQQLNLGIRNAGGVLDPHSAPVQQDGFVFRNIFDRLIYLGIDGSLVPWLATSWEANDDATEWTLSLRDDVIFHDGTPFNAEAAKFNFDRMVDPATGSTQAGPSLAGYLGTEVLDATTVRVTFDRPSALFTFNLTAPVMGMVSPTAVETYGDEFANQLIGSGPYKLVSTISRVETILERNPDYNWGPAHFHEGPAYIERVRFVFINEQESRMATLNTGENQIVDEVAVSAIEGLQQDPDFEVYISPRVGINRGHVLNAALPPTDDIRVRQAIIHAVDREALNQVVFRGYYPVAYQVLTRGVRFYDESIEGMYPYDPERAIALLEEAGWTEINSEGYRVKDGKVLEVAHATWESSVSEPPALIAQSQLRDIGIRMTIEFPGNYTGTVNSADSPFNSALLAVYNPDPGVLLYRSFHSSNIGATNVSHYGNPELDALLEAGLETADEAERAEIYAQVQRILMEEALNAPIYSNVSIFAVRSEVEGFQLDLYSDPEIFEARFRE
jgi:peptide/nickel transport system substrate-binding protein